MKKLTIGLASAFALFFAVQGWSLEESTLPGQKIGFRQMSVTEPLMDSFPERLAQEIPRPTLKSQKKPVQGKLKKGQAPPKYYPQSYQIKFRIVGDQNETLKSVPELTYEFVSVIESEPSPAEPQKLAVSADGTATITCELEDPFDTGYVLINFADNEKQPRMWQFVDVTQAVYVLPVIKPEANKKPKVHVAEAPAIQLQKLVVDMALKGLPKGATFSINRKKVAFQRTEDGLCRFSLPRDLAQSSSFDIAIEQTTDEFARKATLEASKQFSSTNPIKSDGLNVIEFDPKLWVIQQLTVKDFVLQEALPSLASIDGVTLYSGADIKSAIGQPDRVEKSYPGFTADGSEYWIYSAKGVVLKVKSIFSGDKVDAPCVEAIFLTASSAGKFAGVGVGDDVALVEDRLGAQPKRSKPNARSYFGDGLVFDFDMNSKKVTMIELWRSLPLLTNAMEPVAIEVPNHVYIVPRESSQAVGITGEFGEDVVQTLVPMAKWVNRRLASTESIRQVKTSAEADWILAWNVSKIFADSGKGTMHGSMSVLVSITSKFDEKFSYTIESGRISYNSFLKGSSGELGRRLFEKVINPMCDKFAQHLTFLNRVRSLDAEKGEVILDFGTKECELKPGTAFEVFNGGLPAFSSNINPKSLSTAVGGSGVDPTFGYRIVLITDTVQDHQATAKFGVLYRQKKISGQAYIDRVVPLKPKDWKPFFARMIDPRTSLLFVRFRPVFDITDEELKRED